MLDGMIVKKYEVRVTILKLKVTTLKLTKEEERKRRLDGMILNHGFLITITN